MTADHLARLITIACHLYYNHAMPTVGDAEYDKWCAEVARMWDELSPLRQWQLGSPEEICATGYHVKITWAGIEAAAQMLWDLKRIKLPRTFSEELQWSEEHKVHYMGMSG